MRRRPFLATASGAAVVGLAGCATLENGEEDDDAAIPEVEEDPDEVESDGPLRIATYSSMVTGEDSFGRWLTETFETAFPDAELEWTIPESGIEHYRQRATFGAGIDADVYLGLSATDLALVADVDIAREDGDEDEGAGESEPTHADGSDEAGADRPADGSLFEPLDDERLERRTDLRSDLESAFGDDRSRAVPVGYGYATPVVDERALERSPLESLADLPGTVAGDGLLAQHPRYSTPGRAFLCWTVAAFGDDYLEFWRSLDDADLEVHDHWSGAYEAYLDGDRPMVVSYSTDRVGAVDDGRDLEGHRVVTPDNGGYRTVEGAAIVAGTDQRDLAYAFLNFLHTDEVQSELAIRNRQFPALETEVLERPALVQEYAVEPDDPVTIAYDDLTGTLDSWIEAWEEEIGD